jgi:hypothetical protein
VGGAKERRSGLESRQLGCGAGGGGEEGKEKERETGPGGENWPIRVGIPFFYFKFFSNS